MWNEEPYFANLIPIIFVFTFVYSIILYAFSKAKEGNTLVFNYMIKAPCFRSDRGVIEENVLYHCLWRLNMNSYNLRSDRVIEDLQKTSYADYNLGKLWYTSFYCIFVNNKVIAPGEICWKNNCRSVEDVFGILGLTISKWRKGLSINS